MDFGHVCLSNDACDFQPFSHKRSGRLFCPQPLSRGGAFNTPPIAILALSLGAQARSLYNLDKPRDRRPISASISVSATRTNAAGTSLLLAFWVFGGQHPKFFKNWPVGGFLGCYIRCGKHRLSCCAQMAHGRAGQRMLFAVSAVRGRRFRQSLLVAVAAVCGRFPPNYKSLSEPSAVMWPSWYARRNNPKEPNNKG